MTQSIPASALVTSIPAVLGPGGNPVEFIAAVLDENTAIPYGTVASYPSLAAVQAFFGISSVEAAIAGIYFGGFEGCTQLPPAILFMQYNAAAVAGYVRGASLAGLTLTQLQALSGTLITNTDGVSSTSLAINLAGATSFTNAAALITTGIQGGTPTSAAVCTYDAQRAAFVITSSTTGVNSLEGFVSGTLAAGLKFTQATGAVLSPGAAVQTPAGAVVALVNVTQNWVNLMTSWEPNLADKVAFSNAINAQPGNQFIYAGWDTDVTPTEGPSEPTTFAGETSTNNGRVAIWGLANGATRPDGTVVANDGALAKAAFFCGATASIDFDAENGRLDYAYKLQAGLLADVFDLTTSQNLEANGYNFYGAYASKAVSFINFQRGQISGSFKWADSYVCQIKLNSDMQVATIQYLQKVKSVPYVQRGLNGIRSALLDPIGNAVTFGSIVAGGVLSSAQIAEINTAAGNQQAAQSVMSAGYYLQILQASPEVRTMRGSPPTNLWYFDGGSVQRVSIGSIVVQ